MGSHPVEPLMFRRVRIAVLLGILVVVALNAFTDSLYTTSWKSPLTVALLPINADGSERSADYLSKLSVESFAPLEEFFQAEAEQYGVKMDRPLRFTLAPQLHSLPPAVNPRPNVPQIMWWSLRLRWWSWRLPKPPGPTARIRLALQYYDPAQHPVLDHSVGLKKGLIGVVKLFADQRMSGANSVVIAHELLHTLGATDKYHPSDNLPIYPEGYAEPDRQPRWPQRYAELMAGRIPLREDRAQTPGSLKQVLVGRNTAAEIGWGK
jgi:hypothetical protein